MHYFQDDRWSVLSTQLGQAKSSSSVSRSESLISSVRASSLIINCSDNAPSYARFSISIRRSQPSSVLALIYPVGIKESSRSAEANTLS
jgi:hypothetical protein